MFPSMSLVGNLRSKARAPLVSGLEQKVCGSWSREVVALSQRPDVDETVTPLCYESMLYEN